MVELFNRVVRFVILVIYRLTGYWLLKNRPYQCGLFPLSGDPVHYGHVATVEQALEICDKVVVLIMLNSSKSGTLTFDERLAHAKLAFRRIIGPRIDIMVSNGTMVDQFLKHGCDVLIRGVRDRKDADYERTYVDAQRDLFPWFKAPVETLTARGAFKTISSSLIKEGIKYFVAVDRFVPVATHQLLQEKINGQHLIGVTGGIACGKTTTIANFRSFLLATFGFETHVIVVDQLLRDLYADRESRDCQRIRRELAKRFGSQVLTADGFDVNRAFLAKKLMDGSPEASAHLRFVEELTMPSVRRLFHERLSEIRSKAAPHVKQLIFIEWAQAVSSGLSRWSNNVMIVVDAPAKERNTAVERRNIPPERFAATRAVQGSGKEIAGALRTRVDRDDAGCVIEFENRWLSPSVVVEADYHRLAEQIFHLFPGVDPRPEKMS